jgi:Carboxypeptidase regulatory-like domain
MRFDRISSIEKENAMSDARLLRRSFLVPLVLISLVILFRPSDAAAQASAGALVGNVSDESGGAVPGATITATEVRTSISRTALSNETGNYSFTNLARVSIASTESSSGSENSVETTWRST